MGKGRKELTEGKDHESNKAFYEIVENKRGEFSLKVANPETEIVMSIIPAPDRFDSSKDKVDEVEVLFSGLDENTFTIDSEDAPGINTVDRSFWEEFGDRYAPMFLKVGLVGDSDEAFDEVFVDIVESRERRNAEAKKGF